LVQTNVILSDVEAFLSLSLSLSHVSTFPAVDIDCTRSEGGGVVYLPAPSPI